VEKWLRQRFLARPVGPCGAFVDMKEVNAMMRDWIVQHMEVEAKEALRMLEKNWRLPVRARFPVAAVDESASVTVVLSKKKTMAYRYLHWVVYHFYERIGNNALSTYSTYVNEEDNKGTLRRVRGRRTKFEVVFLPAEASSMLYGDAFITEAVSRSGLLCAMAAVFQSFHALYLFTEAAPTSGGPRVLVCSLAHLAFVTMKVRQHLKKRGGASVSLHSDPDAAEAVAVAAATARAAARAAGASAAAQHDAAREAAASATAAQLEVAPGSNSGHRAEWVEELPVLADLLAAQGGRASNGLRFSDGADPRRADPTHMPAVPVDLGVHGGALACGPSPPPPPPSTADDAEGEDADDGADMTEEDEEEAPVRRQAHAGVTPRSADVSDAR